MTFGSALEFLPSLWLAIENSSLINGPMRQHRIGPLIKLEFSIASQRLGKNSRAEPKVIFNDRW
jgi:hypothetical protein